MRSMFLLIVVLLALPASAVTMEWVTVGDPGNACDLQSQGCFGSVGYAYKIGKYEVTTVQYVEFLNAVAATDPNGLYNAKMGDPNLDPPAFSGRGGITRSGSVGSYTYNPIAGRENMPVNYVSFWDALRFANWLHNGQPTGAQGNATTEDGAYTIPEIPALWDSPRNPGATIVMPLADEWYKAAYYDPVSNRYFDFPAGSDVRTTCTEPGVMANTANCVPAVGEPRRSIYDLTDVGIYSGAASPNGTFDQGGNVFEWSGENFGSNRGVRGGGFSTAAEALAASLRQGTGSSQEGNNLGFRVAMIAHPPIAVEISIKPGNDVNPINPRSRGIIPVAILGSDTFDPEDVDETTPAFGPNAVMPRHDLTEPETFIDHLRDVNEDGFTDLVTHYRTQEIGFAIGDAEACISGELLDGTPFEGCDTVEVIGTRGSRR
jgi:formylglycine-generating enzyme required for sulfatase activity